MSARVKLLSVCDCITYTDSAISSKVIDFKFMSDAPFWVKLVALGSYVAYKNVVYVPAVHFDLSTSKSSQDRILATAKVLPYVMAIKDDQVSNPVKLLRFLLSHRLTCFYFLYEYLFLRSVNHPYQDAIYGGFLACGARYGILRRSPDKTADILNDIVKTGSL